MACCRVVLVAGILAMATAQQFGFGRFPGFTVPTLRPFTFPFPGIRPGGGGGQTNQQLVQDCGRVQVNPQSGLALRQRRQSPQSSPPATGTPETGVFSIVGGQNVRDGDWPWMVLLGEQLSGVRHWTCGGTLISSRTVLTAAHCVDGRQPGALTARLGEFDTQRDNDGTHVDASVSRIIVHPGYRPPARHDDIALLQLSQPVVFGDRIQPACLPPPSADHTGRDAKVAGWGLTEFNGQTAAILQEATVTVANVGQCESSYRTRGDFFETTFPGGFQGTKLCAQGPEKDSCEGDSGGPLTVTEADQRRQVIGVVSLGLGCGLPDFPGIYTKVSQYIPWIMQNTN